VDRLLGQKAEIGLADSFLYQPPSPLPRGIIPPSIGVEMRVFSGLLHSPQHWQGLAISQENTIRQNFLSNNIAILSSVIKMTPRWRDRALRGPISHSIPTHGPGLMVIQAAVSGVRGSS
jgi:hypothetical protein